MSFEKSFGERRPPLFARTTGTYGLVLSRDCWLQIKAIQSHLKILSPSSNKNSKSHQSIYAPKLLKHSSRVILISQNLPLPRTNTPSYQASSRLPTLPSPTHLSGSLKRLSTPCVLPTRSGCPHLSITPLLWNRQNCQLQSSPWKLRMTCSPPGCPETY